MFPIILSSSIIAFMCTSHKSLAMLSTFSKTHTVCRKPVPYPKTDNIMRFQIPQDKVAWTIELKEYKPVEFTHRCIGGQVWADEEISDENRTKFQWNTLDGNINRKSYNGDYTIDEISGRPRNPFGRTGLTGRGSLGRWGPNHAADPIVTRWKTVNNSQAIDETSLKPILEFLAIQRRVGKAWALPGGMVDIGEQAVSTAQREFSEEALNSLTWTPEHRESQEQVVKEMFAKADPVYKGYVDDARNTDNAWMETVAFHVHDDTGDLVSQLKLCAGDDAVDVKWMRVDENTSLFANHNDLIHLVAVKMNSHWANTR